MNKIKHLFTCLLMGWLLAACSEVDLCESPHPHQGTLHFQYDWNNQEDSKPDTMGVLIYRVVGQWKRLVGVNTTDLTIDRRDSVCVPVGDYKFVTFPLDTTKFCYDELRAFMEGISAEQPLQEVGIEYKQYDSKSPELRKTLLGWDDYNPYALYVQPDINVLYYDTTQIVTIGQDQALTQRFTPRSLSQSVDVNFEIHKDIDDTEFVIDSVWADISGIPRHINLNNGHLDISKTNKVMFPITLTNASGQRADTYTNKTLKCHGNINVSGIVNVQQGKGESEDDVRRKVYGPGILQVIIYSHTKDADTGKLHKRKSQGIINLYTPLTKARLITVTPDGRYAIRNGAKGVINITAELVIDGSKIQSDNDGDDALERWIPTSSLIVDI